MAERIGLVADETLAAIRARVGRIAALCTCRLRNDGFKIVRMIVRRNDFFLVSAADGTVVDIEAFALLGGVIGFLLVQHPVMRLGQAFAAIIRTVFGVVLCIKICPCFRPVMPERGNRFGLGAAADGTGTRLLTVRGAGRLRGDFPIAEDVLVRLHGTAFLRAAFGAGADLQAVVRRVRLDRILPRAEVVRHAARFAERIAEQDARVVEPLVVMTVEFIVAAVRPHALLAREDILGSLGRKVAERRIHRARIRRVGACAEALLGKLEIIVVVHAVVDMLEANGRDRRRGIEAERVALVNEDALAVHTRNALQFVGRPNVIRLVVDVRQVRAVPVEHAVAVQRLLLPVEYLDVIAHRRFAVDGRRKAA